jgi:hypothetical protein
MNTMDVSLKGKRGLNQMKLVRVSIFRKGTTTEGKLFGLFMNEERAKQYINNSISKYFGRPIQLRWTKGKDEVTARSQNLRVHSKAFGDKVNPNSYFLWADDYESHAVQCTCGHAARLIQGHSRYQCLNCYSDIYYNVCWSCGATIDSRVNKGRCGCCGYFYCTCGAHSQYCDLLMYSH